MRKNVGKDVVNIRKDVRRRLIEVAGKRETIAYSELMKKFGLTRGGHPNSKVRVGDVVGKISEDEDKQGKNNPMLSAIVVHKDRKTIGDGFYELAEHLGRLEKGQDKKAFWKREQERVWKHRY